MFLNCIFSELEMDNDKSVLLNCSIEKVSPPTLYLNNKTDLTKL